MRKLLLMLLFTSGVFLPLDVLVDNSHPLPETYSPGELPEAKEAIGNLIEFLEAESDLNIVIRNGFRSFETQKFLHELWCQNGSEYCRDFSALPGYSEHQLGTTYDLSLKNSSLTGSENRSLWQLLEENAHKYGFVISYPYKECEAGNNKTTPLCGVEFKWEPWHIRYVGDGLAAEIYQSGYLNPESLVIPQDFYTVYDLFQKE